MNKIRVSNSPFQNKHNWLDLLRRELTAPNTINSFADFKNVLFSKLLYLTIPVLFLTISLALSLLWSLIGINIWVKLVATILVLLVGGYSLFKLTQYILLRNVHKSVFEENLSYKIQNFRSELEEGYNHYQTGAKAKNENVEHIFTEKLYLLCKDISNLLADRLSKQVGNEIRIHIKHFPKQEVTDTLRMLCLSSNNPQNRLTANNHKISENTHLEIVFSKDNIKGYFFSENFEKYVADYDAKNTEKFKITAQNWEVNYKTLLLFPIKDNSKNLGLVFCDSAKTNVISKKDVVNCVEIIHFYADGLCTCFKQYAAYIKKLDFEKETTTPSENDVGVPVIYEIATIDSLLSNEKLKPVFVK